MTRESNKSVQIGDKLYNSYHKQGKVRVVVPGNLSLAPPSKSKVPEKPYDRIKGRSPSDPGIPPLVSDPPRRSSGQSGLTTSSDQSSPNFTSKKTVTFALPSLSDHTYHTDTPTKSMTNLSDFEKSSSSAKPMASLSTEKKITSSGRDKERGVVSPAVGVVKSNTGHLQTSKPAGNNTIDKEKNTHSTKQGKSGVNKITPSPSPHHNKPPQTASTSTQPSTSGSIDALISSSLNSLVSTLISSNKASSSATTTSVSSDKLTKRKLDREIESVVKKRKMSGNSSTTTSEDETRANVAAISPARKKPRKNVAVKKTPYKVATGAESTGNVDQHKPTTSKANLMASSESIIYLFIQGTSFIIHVPYVCTLLILHVHIFIL